MTYGLKGKQVICPCEVSMFLILLDAFVCYHRTCSSAARMSCELIARSRGGISVLVQQAVGVLQTMETDFPQFWRLEG